MVAGARAGQLLPQDVGSCGILLRCRDSEHPTNP